MDTVAGKSEKEFFEQLRAVFEKMSHEIPLYMFVDPGQDDDFIQTGRQMVRAFRELTEKITFREFPLDHEMAKKWQVTASPTLLIAPETYAIRWLGAPVGEEGRTFLETLILVGRRQSNLNDQARKVIQNIDSKRQVKVFVSPSCPYCPQQAVNAVRAVIEKPELISLEIIDIMANPEMADQYGAQSVPQAFANEILIGMGAQTEEIFALSLQKLEPQTLFIPDSDAELVKTDLLIVGGGPAGLTAGIYA
ncbi:MAG: thioredoxin family protein, partial [Deltaproteobacteria bacterium]|nr:thioredoxin family protein [Deltaproteobacteria bacterium]